MFARRIVQTLCGIVLLGVLGSSAVGAAFVDARRTTYFTFSRSVQVTGVVLPAGTYIFEVADSTSGSDIVRVMSRDRSKVHLTKFTRAVYREQKGTLNPIVSFGETPAGQPPIVKAWYPMSETRGREFVYDK